MSERISREEIALRIFCAFVQSGRPVGPENVRESFALAQAFEEHSDKIGARPWRTKGFTKLGPDDDGS